MGAKLYVRFDFAGVARVELSIARNNDTVTIASTAASAGLGPLLGTTIMGPGPPGITPGAGAPGGGITSCRRWAKQFSQ